ncbi:hypothetical protein G7046_g6042 [Stylonectria norvegica]|nr:hypothetical protein G7046_g6042 [Stylonectria norvegica]
MHLTSLFVALLPALALAQSDSALTTTQTSTKHLTKTYFLSQIHTVTAVHSNTTSTFVTTAVSTSVATTDISTTFANATTSATGYASGTGSGTAASASSTVVAPNAGSALEAGKLAFAGVAGMVIAAMM